MTKFTIKGQLGKAILGFTALFISQAVATQKIKAENTQAPILSVDWHFETLPSVYSGDGRYTGVGDRLWQWYTRHMPEFVHNHLESVPIRRTISRMVRGEAICQPFFLNTDAHANDLYLSEPLLWVPAERLIVRKNLIPHLAKFKVGPHIDLAHLLISGEKRIGFVGGRSYTKYISNVLDKHGHSHKNIYQARSTSQLLKMMASGRIDIIIEFPWTAEKSLGSSPQTGNFAHIPISGAPTWISAHTACGRSALGHEIIRRVNQLAHKAGPIPPYIREYFEFQGLEIDPALARKYHEAYEGLVKLSFSY